MKEIAGYDPNDSTSANVKIPNYYKQLNSNMNGKIIGHEVNNFMRWDIDDKFDFMIAEILAKANKLRLN